MEKRHKKTLFVFLSVTLLYWGLYNWIAYGVKVQPEVKMIAAFIYLFFVIPTTGVTYENSDND